MLVFKLNFNSKRIIWNYYPSDLLYQVSVHRHSNFSKNKDIAAVQITLAVAEQEARPLEAAVELD